MVPCNISFPRPQMCPAGRKLLGSLDPQTQSQGFLLTFFEPSKLMLLYQFDLIDPFRLFELGVSFPLRRILWPLRNKGYLVYFIIHFFFFFFLKVGREQPQYFQLTGNNFLALIFSSYTWKTGTVFFKKGNYPVRWRWGSYLRWNKEGAGERMTPPWKCGTATVWR